MSIRRNLPMSFVLLGASAALALTVEIADYDADADKVSFSFTGVERDLSLFALWDDGDKGPVPCAYAETWPMGEIAAGTTKQSRHEWNAGMRNHPQSANTAPAPTECDRFQIDCFVESSFGGNHCGSVLMHGPTPMPWK